jgi:type IV secretory pathway VirB4 component
MYIVLNYVWNKTKSDQKRRILVVDEAWQMMKYEDSANFLFSLAKRARKYNLGLTTVTQDVEDFMGSRMGRAIVANASMQFLLKQSPSAIDMLTDVFKLTSEEKKRLSQFPVGQGLFFAGSNHVHIQIVASATETSLITTNPKEIVNTVDLNLNKGGGGVAPTNPQQVAIDLGNRPQASSLTPV